jgi:hypothetical protein
MQLPPSRDYIQVLAVAGFTGGSNQYAMHIYS